MSTIKNPVEWTGAQLTGAAHVLGNAVRSLHHVGETVHSQAPEVRRIAFADLKEALRKGLDDFGAYRSDVIFVGAIYAVAGLILARLAWGLDLLPLVFPLASGFAIVGPFAAVGLYEMSRRREQGLEAKWANALDVFRSPAFGALMVVGLMLIALYLAWLSAAWLIYEVTLGSAPITSVEGFLRDVFFTDAGRVMIVVGVGVGAVFALAGMAVGVVSLPMLIDRDAGLDTAIKTSVRAVAANPLPMAAWGAIVTAGLVLGSIPLFVGLIVVLPVLGHATWHLYRRLVAWPDARTKLSAV
jgi:uncharacterized membrane protein